MPTAVSDENYTFQQGTLGDGPDKVVITQLVIYQSAAHIAVRGSTDAADKVFGKLVEILEGFGVRRPVSPPVSFYRSNIICDFDKAATPLFTKLEAISRIVQKAIEYPEAEVHGSGIALLADPQKLPRAISTYNPTFFPSIERPMLIFR
jgi:hypothetical protein